VAGKIGELVGKAKEINKMFPKKPVPYTSESGFIVYSWHVNDYNAPARVKTASQRQIETWPELSAQRDWPAYQKPYILWTRCSSIQDQVKVA